MELFCAGCFASSAIAAIGLPKLTRTGQKSENTYASTYTAMQKLVRFAPTIVRGFAAFGGVSLVDVTSLAPIRLQVAEPQWAQ